MDNDGNIDRKQKLGTVMFSIAYGIAVLAILATAGHMNWIHLRPATGTANALYSASDHSRASADDADGRAL